MTDMVQRGRLSVDRRLAEFIDGQIALPLGQDTAAFWQGFSQLVHDLAPKNRALLVKRETLQRQIDAWHQERRGHKIDLDEYREFLEEIGYLVPEPEPFTIGTQNVDPEIATMAGPQLVVPVLNARFLLNAANARWGSLYDAFYGTDALDAPAAKPGGYDEDRGAAVIAQGRRFLDEALPLQDGSWADLGDTQDIPLADTTQYVGKSDRGRLFKNNGLHIEVVFDRGDPVGRGDQAGIADIMLEAALTTIVDLEDSVAAVDAEDKLLAYANWLGVIRGDLEETFAKGGKSLTRKLEEDKRYTAPDGSAHTLPGRSLLFVRNVGHLMTSPAILLEDGEEIPEGIMDAVITAAVGALGLAGNGRYANSRTGSIYIVKPKMHGPQECAFTGELFDRTRRPVGVGTQHDQGWCNG